MILVVVEHDAGAPDRLSSEALTLGATLAGATGSQLAVVAWGPDAAGIAGRLATAGVTVLHVIEDLRLTDYAPEAIGKAIAQLVARERPDIVIVEMTERFFSDAPPKLQSPRDKP